MRIGVMLRTIDEKGGIGVYTQNVMDNLLRLDRKNEYVLFYRNSAYLGRYAGRPNVREKVVSAPNKFVWDQVRIPLEARKERLDVIFNTKFTVPLLTRCKTVMVLHGTEWFVYPQFSQRMDIMYVKLMMPLYHRTADRVIAVSNRAREDISQLAGADHRRITTVYLAPDERFRQPVDEAALNAVRTRYNLPERFILNVGAIYPGKNVKNLLLAYAKIRDRVPQKLVLAGRMRWKYHHDQLAPIKKHGLQDDVLLPGWIPQEDLPALYRLADLFLFPSYYESCSVALLEAMASGCPIVTSGTGGTPEVVGDAALLIQPDDPDGIAEAAYRALTDQMLRREMVQRGLERSKLFSWDKTALETLAVLKGAVEASVPAVHPVHARQPR